MCPLRGTTLPRTTVNASREELARAEAAIGVFSGFQYLRIVKSSGAEVFVVRDSWRPWRRNESAEEKKQLLDRLYRECGFCAVWLDSRFATIASAATPASELLEGADQNDWCGWFEADMSVLRPLSSCQEGGWGCLFYSLHPHRMLSPTSPLPTEPGGLTHLLVETEAEAAVVSEIDDVYWLVGFNPRAGASKSAYRQ